jgi:hypothetical protein
MEAASITVEGSAGNHLYPGGEKSAYAEFPDVSDSLKENFLRGIFCLNPIA